MGVSKKLRTPIIKPRRQGGTFYTFSSALEDVGLNINELKNKVALSHYVLLDIPAFAKDASLAEEFPEGANVGDYTFASKFQNYALNMETVLRNQSTYNFAESLTVSERVFWKFLKHENLISFEPEVVDASTESKYFVETSDVVKGFGAISAGAQRTDAYGIYNETFVQVPSSFGKMKTLFKPVSDKNYHITPGIEDYFISSSESGYIENVGETEIDSSALLHTGISAKAIYDVGGVDTSFGYVVNDESEELCVEFSLSELRDYYNIEDLTYDDLAMEGIGLPLEDVDESYTFNAILVYYSIYDSTGKNILATNAYGVLLLDSAVPAEYDENEDVSHYKFPSVEKKKTTLATAGSSYAFRINIKTSSVYSGDITVCDDSTPAFEMSTEFNDVLRNLTAAVETLKSNANVIKVISSSNTDIKNLAMKTLDKIDDIEKDIANIKSGVTRHLKANEATISSLDASTMKARVNFYDDVHGYVGGIDGSTFNIHHISSDSLHTDELDSSIINTDTITTLDKDLHISNGKDTEYLKISPIGMYVNQEVFVPNYAESTIEEPIDDNMVNTIFDNTTVCFDASTYVLRLPELSAPECSGPILKTLYTSVGDESNVVAEEYKYYNLSTMLMLMISQLKNLSGRTKVIETALGIGPTDSSIDSSVSLDSSTDLS